MKNRPDKIPAAEAGQSVETSRSEDALYKKMSESRKIERRSDAFYRPLQWTIVKRMLQCLRGYMPLFIPMLCLLGVGMALDVWQPMLTRRAIDIDIKKLHSARSLMWTVGIIISVLTASYLCRAFSSYIARLISERIYVDLRGKIFDKIQQVDMSYFDRTPIGILISRGHRDVMIVVTVMIRVVSVLLESIVTYFGVMALLFVLDPPVFFMVLAVSPLMAVSSYVYHRRGRLAWRRVRRDIARLTANVAEMTSGVRVVQAFGRQEQNLDRYDDMNQVNTRSYMRTARYQGWYMMVVESLAFISATLVLGRAAWQVAHGRMEFGIMLALWLYIGMVFQPVRRIANLYNNVLHAMAAGERVFALLDREPAIMDKPDAQDIGRIKGDIEFQDVTFAYVHGRPVLHEISFEVPAATTLALVGHTGCGKTSIINLLNRFYEPDAGSIKIDGCDIREMQLRCLHSQTGLILQENFLFDGTVMDNILYAAHGKTPEQAIELCKMLGCDHIFARLSEGYDTAVGQRGENLSAGQRQLVSIARAMAADPRILMLDEATSSVDTQTELAIQYALEKLMERRTCFVVAHRLSTVRRAEQILVMDHGKIMERGTHEQLLDMNGLYSNLHEEFMKIDDSLAN